MKSCNFLINFDFGNGFFLHSFDIPMFCEKKKRVAKIPKLVRCPCTTTTRRRWTHSPAIWRSSARWHFIRPLGWPLSPSSRWTTRSKCLRTTRAPSSGGVTPLYPSPHSGFICIFRRHILYICCIYYFSVVYFCCFYCFIFTCLHIHLFVL